MHTPPTLRPPQYALQDTLRPRRRLGALLLALAGAAVTPVAPAAPLAPGGDAQVVERLPPRLLPRAAARDAAAAAPALTAAQAVRAARPLVEAARAAGDPRPAGQALALLAPWRDAPDAPPEVALLLATVEQHLHDFDGAARRLQALLARAPAQPQAWLTLATVRRVQGRLDDSDAACRELAALRAAPLHARACLAENAALRGRVREAQAVFEALLAEAGADLAARGWLLTSLGELHARAGRAGAAEQAFRASLQARPDGYTALALADLLLAQGRTADAQTLLRREPRSDAMLLRLAAAAGPDSADAVAELRERMAQAALRPGTVALDARERALFELDVQGDARAALAAARDNVTRQREPLDLLLLARAARAAGDAAALAQTRTLLAEVGLHDRRIDDVLAR